MNHATQAADAFTTGLACSQAVLSAYAADLGLNAETALKVSAGFGGGMGRMAGTCGAVTGAVMVIGMRLGAASGKDQEAKLKTYAAVREFAARFKARHGSLTCRELLGCDISTPQGAEAMKQQGLHDKVCSGLVRDACHILDDLLGA